MSSARHFARPGQRVSKLWLKGLVWPWPWRHFHRSVVIQVHQTLQLWYVHVAHVAHVAWRQRRLKQCIGFVVHFKQDHEKCRHNINFTLSRIYMNLGSFLTKSSKRSCRCRPSQKRSKPICSSSLVIINPFGTPICTGGIRRTLVRPVCTASPASPSAGNPWRQHSAVATSHVHPVSRASNRQWWSSRYSRRPWKSSVEIHNLCGPAQIENQFTSSAIYIYIRCSNSIK